MKIPQAIIIGYLKGEKCDRKGCEGIIQEGEKDGCCSCHIAPPCSYCTTPVEYCPECGWEAIEEQVLDSVKQEDKDLTFWRQFQDNTKRELDKTKIDWHHENHTHFSMKKVGVYPDGTTQSEVEEKVRGTFGGRFESFGHNKFSYIAYTD